MKDLTKGSITIHILEIAAPIAISVLAQIAYQLISLYFVSRIGVAATAGVSAAGNAIFAVMALTQVLSVGTAALIAHSVGRKDRLDASLVFNQSLILATVGGVSAAALLGALRRPYLEWVAADAATAQAGATFILWALPGYALLFPFVAISSALRGTGLVRPPTFIYMLTIFLNALLAPVLIAGYGTGVPLGVKGAGLATSLSVAAGLVALGAYFLHSERYVMLVRLMLRPQPLQWRRIVTIGLPAGGEFALSFFYAAFVYYVIRVFGADAQAGFGIGSRVLQIVLLPGMAVAFAAGPIAGQNFGAKDSDRVRETLHKSASMTIAVMIATSLIVQWRPDLLLNFFDADAAAFAIAISFLQLMSWTFVSQGLVYTCSNMFQGLGNTAPALVSSASRFFLFALCAQWLSARASFHIEQIWHLSIAALTLQAVLSLWLLRREMKARLSSAWSQLACKSDAS